MLDFFDVSGVDDFRVFISFISLLLIVTGWIVVNSQNNKREFRKELRSAVDEVIVQVLEITENGVEYHAGKKDRSLEAKIVLSFKSLNRRVDRLPFSSNEKESLKYHLRGHKKSITGVNSFGNNKATASTPNYYTIEIAGILNARDDLLDEIERAFRYKCSVL